MKLAIFLAGIILTIQSAAFAAEKQTAETHEKTIAGGTVRASARLKPNSKAIWAQHDYPGDWDPNHRHWDHPSNFVIYTDGSIFAFAHHLANMLREGPGDEGSDWNFIVSIQVWSGQYVNNACQGSVMGSVDVNLGDLAYQDERWDQSATGSVSADQLSQCHCWTATRYIRH